MENTRGNEEIKDGDATRNGSTFLRTVFERLNIATNHEVVDDETMEMVERVVIVRLSTKHINLWTRQLEMKRKEMSELAGLMGLVGIKKEIQEEKELERWARRCTTHFTKKMKRVLYEGIDNIVWSGEEEEIVEWCKRNKVYDEITDGEIEEIWRKVCPDDVENVRLNGKYVWETAKRVCDFINAHEDLIAITTFGEYRDVMKK